MKSGLRVATIGLIAVAATSCSAPPPTVPPPQALVKEIVDGDTIVVASGHRTEIVRLIGIDTPEVAHHGQPGECFGPEAAAHLASLAPVGSVVVTTVIPVAKWPIASRIWRGSTLILFLSPLII